jgi:hypothetical protein
VVLIFKNYLEKFCHQNYITDILANKAVFIADAVPGPSALKLTIGKPLRSGEKNTVLNVFDYFLQSILLCQLSKSCSMSDFTGRKCF